MKKILEAVDELAKELQDKGYDGMFQTEGGFGGKLKDSMLNYMEAAVMGNEKGLKNGISLFTYLEWDGPEKEYVTAWMYARLPSDRFTINMISLTLADQFGKIKNIDVELAGKPLPTKEEAIAIIKPQQKLQRKRSIKF